MKTTFAVVSLLLFPAAFAQPAFTSIEIHLSKLGTDNGGMGILPNGQVAARGATMLDLIRFAYDIEEDVLIGGPSWLDSARFDINTKSAPIKQQEVGKAMMQKLLADRFKLSFRKEERPMSVYALTVGKRGSKLKESPDGELDCDQKNAPPNRFTLTCKHMTLQQLAPQLRRMGFLDHPVVDTTGMKGAFDFSMVVTLPGQRQRPGLSDPDRAPDISVFEAVDKDLGLKLEASKQPMTVLVIDNFVKTAAEASDATPVTQKAAEFEVATIRPSKPGTPSNMRLLPSGQAEMTSQPMKFILQIALNVDQDRIVGIPKWAEAEPYDVIAKAPPADLNLDTLPAMLKALLADRLKLTTHEDQAPIAVYVLTVSKRGIKLKEADASVRSSCRPSAANGKKVLTCQNTTMAELADRIRGQAPAYIDHAVVDLTGMKGAYDFSFAWTTRGQVNAGQGSAADGAASDPNGAVSVFEGIEKDIGIKLELTKHPMPVTVIDRLERVPTEN